MENLNLSAWVHSRIELLAAPADWEPNVQRALARQALRAEASGRGRRALRRVLLAVAGVVLGVSIAATALSRRPVLAQSTAEPWHPFEQAWNWVAVVWRGPVLLLANPGAALSVETVKGPGEPQPVANAAEAAARAGFAPRLPDASFLPPPRLAVNGPITTATDWEGHLRLTLEIGTTVTAAWRATAGWSELLLIQGRLPAITAPPGFDLRAFGISALGLPMTAARPGQVPWVLFGRATSAPAILSGYLPQQFTALKEVPLEAGPATLMEECSKRDENHQQVDRITLLWNVSDRAYVLRGEREVPPSVQGWDFAAALTSVIEIANAIR